MFLKKFIEFLRSKIGFPSKIIYFSDGCVAQYKNRYNMLNLVELKEDFGMDANGISLRQRTEKGRAMDWAER